MPDHARAARHGLRRLPVAHVPRHRLVDAVLPPGTTVTLVRGPAGFGKSTVVREWLDHSDDPALYYAVPAHGGSATRMWRALVDGLRAVDGAAADAVSGLLNATDPDLDRVVDGLVDAAGEMGAVIVIEDLHNVATPDTAEAVARLVDLTRPPVRLLLTSRTQPALPVARLRARGDLTELGTDDLRFTTDEVARLLSDAEIGAEPALVDHLMRTTGGWPAGLSLTLSSARRSGDPAACMAAAHAGSTVRDLLRAEVIDQLPAATVEVLTVTSFLDVVSPGLCDAVTGRDDSATMLRELAAGETFVHLIEGPGEWYRLHQMLADLLRGDLAQRPTAERTGLHRRAAEWFVAEGDPALAIEHLLAAGDQDGAVDLVLEHAYQLADTGDLEAARRALRSIGDRLTEDPHRALDTAVALAFSGVAPPALRILDELARLDSDDTPLLGRLAVVECLVSSYAGDLPAATTALRTARRHLGAVPPDELGARTLLNHARCLRLAGRLDEADTHLRQVVMTDCGSPIAAHIAGGIASDVLLARGRLAEAADAAATAVARWTDMGGPVVIGFVDAFRVLAAVADETGDHDRRDALLDEALRMASHLRVGIGRAAVLVDLALTAARRGDATRADRHLEEITLWWRDLPAGPQLRHAHACAAVEVDLALGRTDTAGDRLDALRALSGAVTWPAYPILRARWRVATGAAAHGDRLDVAAFADAPLPVRLAVVLADAEVASTIGDAVGARRSVEAAWDLGLGAGYRATLARSNAVRRALAAPDAVVVAGTPLAEVAALIGTAGAPGAASTTLTAKELEVLRLLPTHLSYSGIAAELYVSVNTVKFHLKRIYTKLGVDGRDAAVTQARRLGVLPA